MICQMQEMFVKQEKVNMNINGTKFTITKVANYRIAGRAVETYDYDNNITNVLKIVTGKEYYNQISCKDVAISYGLLALNDNHNKMNYSMLGTRKVAYSIKDSSIIDVFGSTSELENHITNNHLIPANSRIHDLIKKISRGDFVQLTGYLVNVNWENGIYYYSLESSLSREDSGNGACEVLLVEDVKWIK